MSISVMLFVLGWHHSKLRNWATICVDTTNDDELGCSVFFLSLVWFLGY